MNTLDHILAACSQWQPAHFGKVAVLMGGIGAEREVSLNSGKQVFAACQELGMDVVALDLGENPIDQLHTAKPDWAFNIIHGDYGENGLLANALELLGIRTPSSNGKAMTLAMDKALTKSLWQQAGLPTPQSLSIYPAKLAGDTLQAKLAESVQLIEQQQLSLPLVIKPANEGSSIGLYINHTETERERALTEALARFDALLVEKLIVGTEITIGIIGNTPLPVIEIQPAAGRYDYHAKYLSDTTQMLLPTSLGEVLEHQAKQLALSAFTCLGCSVWGRVDAMVDRQGDIYLLEVNTLPGLTDHSLVPYAAKSIGINFKQLVQCLFTTALVG